MIGNNLKGLEQGILEPGDFELIDSELIEFVNEYNEYEKKYGISHNIKRSFLKRRGSKYYQSINLRAYKRQYVCVIDKNGDKIVWVNCLCGVTDDWRKRVITVLDGGNCFFNLRINLTKKIRYDGV